MVPKKGRIVLKRSLGGIVCFLASVCVAQDIATAPPLASDAKPIPVLSGGVAFVPTWDSGNPTLVSIISPVLLVPLASNLFFESRAAFEAISSAAMETRVISQDQSRSPLITWNSITSRTDMAR